MTAAGMAIAALIIILGVVAPLLTRHAYVLHRSVVLDGMVLPRGRWIHRDAGIAMLLLCGLNGFAQGLEPGNILTDLAIWKGLGIAALQTGPGLLIVWLTLRILRPTTHAQPVQPSTDSNAKQAESPLDRERNAHALAQSQWFIILSVALSLGMVLFTLQHLWENQ